jgi:hypothetical protein
VHAYLCISVEISRCWKREGVLTTGWSMEHGKQGRVSVHFKSPVGNSWCLFALFLSLKEILAESDQWMQGEPLGLYKLLEECSRSHCSGILPGVGANVPNFRHGNISSQICAQDR